MLQNIYFWLILLFVFFRQLSKLLWILHCSSFRLLPMFKRVPHNSLKYKLIVMMGALKKCSLTLTIYLIRHNLINCEFCVFIFTLLNFSFLRC